MRRAPLLLIATAAAAAVALPAQAPAAARKCSAKAGVTIGKSSTVRVFVRTPGKQLRLYACKNSTRKTTQIDAITNRRRSVFTARSALVRQSRWIGVVFDERSAGAGRVVWICLYDRVLGGEIFNAKLPGVAKNKQFEMTASGGIALLNGGSLVVIDAAGQRTLESAGVTALTTSGDNVVYTVGGVKKSIALSGHPGRQS